VIPNFTASPQPVPGEGQAVSAIAVLTYPNELAEPAAQQGKFRELLLHLVQLGPGRLEDVVSEPGFRGAEQVAYLAEGEPQLPGPADEGKAPLVGFGIFPVARALPFRHGQQAPALVEANSLNPDSRGSSEPAYRQPGHAS
jgi:hypothetical protein